MIEEYKRVPFSSGYMVSNLGNVYCNRSKSLVKQWHDKDGYCKVTLYYPPKRGPKNFSVHRLVATLFLDTPPTGRYTVAHNDGSKTNNVVDNLRWATQKENIADKFVHGTQVRGEKLWNAKLRERDIPVIRAMRNAGAKWDQVGRAFGVSRVAARNAFAGMTWKHVK